MSLPFKQSDPKLPNNRSQALHRLYRLKQSLTRDKKYRDDYIKFMSNIIHKGFAEPVPESELELNNGTVWYIPHHGVYHRKRPNKIRVVFDCSANYKGQSLNDRLLQVPDLTNSLTGVLCRFRQDLVAFICDIEHMVFQFRVKSEHRNFLRFLWWSDDNLSGDPIVMRMTVHLFGAASSSSCTSFGLKETANRNGEKYGKVAADFIRHDFYIDDGLKSTASAEKDIDLIDRSMAMCAEGGLRLHKFVSNSREVLAAVPSENQAKGKQSLDLVFEPLPVETALGVQWCIKPDAFRFRITLQDKPLTRRGILFTVSSIYDPLGFAAPVVLLGKQILQQLCRDSLDWDSPLPDPEHPKWESWRNDLFLLEKVCVQRCVKPANFG
ncbi:uncharacterized protein LOC135467247 [Liolophura sinensis]|uniref:uncharacterized protein LOC135467247 n=1 Tax=Liolophura sinensis TaxID=3198878 RepID=UPI0031597296